MGIFSREEIEKETYSEKLNSAKALFKGAYDDAVALYTEIYKEITATKERLSELEAIGADTKKFIDNIKGLV